MCKYELIKSEQFTSGMLSLHSKVHVLQILMAQKIANVELWE